ncbi:MAG: lysozyme inhibitor LprI family protein [Sulfitobacter sp.]
MIKALTFVLVCGGCAAMAQDLPYSDAATLNCLQSGADAKACIGLSAQMCMNTPEGGSTVGMGGCLDAELTFWDARLNANYQARMVEAKRMDEETREVGATVSSQAEALRTMQRAWIPFRDASCAWEASKWGGGTGAGPAYLACLLDLTADQSITLGPENR